MLVVAAVDGSKHTHRVVENALRFADGDRVDLVYVAEPYVYPNMMMTGQMIDFKALRDSERKHVWEVVGRLPQNATAVDLEGGAASTIVDYAKNVDAGLIVVGSRGRGALGSLFLGSVSHGTIHAADRNVLVVK